ncbi:PTS system cellobiose-specific IIC component [Paenibacillus turicensis]|uniref:Permease IIC component n=1 Tax=Paenibacillus turicensis TaxID=160487 RepID=A0ABS4FU50_9BACL|nr:PTS transporter subunit EIIC [Paenibacillus turicensis]MBP1906069.1 PTS system cellobiose-specific IIC component [Paenibacillus turicensis]
MNNTSTKFSKVLSAVTAFSKNKYVKSVSDSMMTLIGIMVFGSFAVILKAFPIKSVATFFENIGIAPYFGAIYNLTIGAISIYLVFLIAKNLASKFNFGDDSTTVGLIAIMNFLILTPLGNFVSGESNVTAIPLKWLGTSGMFSAIIVGLLVGRGYVFIKEKKWTIKMPPGVPPMVSRSFESLIPTILLGTLSAIIAYLFSLTSFGNMHQLMFTVLQNPLQGIGSSIWAIMLIIAFQQFLWFLGIHGTNIITPVVAPILMALNVENLSAYEAGKEMPHIVTHAFVNIVCWGGTALGLVILMLFVGKSKRYKELGKLSVVPALFGITEPVIFGTPLVLNFKMAIPFIFNNSICLGLAYLLTKIGLVAQTIGAQAVFGLPLGFHASVGGSVSIIILQLLIQLVLSPILWYPWFKMLDKEAVIEEQKILAQ